MIIEEFFVHNNIAYQRQKMSRIDVQFFLKLLMITVCCIIGTNCEPLRGIKELKAALHESRVPPPYLGHCDFERPCTSWNYDAGFKIISTNHRKIGLPKTDANRNRLGHFLWLKDLANRGTKEGQIWSVIIPPTGSHCFLEFSTYQINMEQGVIRQIIATDNITSSVASERRGNNDEKWNVTRLKLGGISQPYRVGLEVVVPFNSSIAIDNIQLDDCFPESKPYYSVHTNCTGDMFRCNNGSCLNRTRICDLTPDCAEGEDEILECEKMPETGRCNFEKGWCGWTNEPDRKLNWTLHRGSTLSDRTGPSYDHTYRNETGTYAFVNSSRSNGLGDRATLSSPIFNPTPPYNSDPKSPYYKSCQVRFFFHQYGTYSGSLGLYVIQMKPHQNQSHRLWWNYGDRKDIWYNEVVAMPDIKYRYILQFEASKGYASKADVAIDDFSLSPECFGIGVPADVVGEFNYYRPVIESEHSMEQHFDFVNETVIKITTCGASGRYGPSQAQCYHEYNGTEMESEVNNTSQTNVTSTNLSEIEKLTNQGLQKWTAPRGGYYTLIVFGAQGGRGSSSMGSTLGAMVRGVIEIEKGQTLYFLVGQSGTDACPKSFGKLNNQCPDTSLNDNNSNNESSMYGITSVIREVKKININNGGGGGGGGTFVFKINDNDELKAIAIAGGGGGLGFGKFIDDGIQHGHGLHNDKNNPISYSTTMSDKLGGAGGGWNTSSTIDLSSRTVGKSFVNGASGGKACNDNNNSNNNKTNNFGDGGFGGGGGGCKSGGGGGGYIGGTSGIKSINNGEGGYSYMSNELIYTLIRSGYNQGHGSVYIIPAISGCGCDFRCVAIDKHLSETKCLCPNGWQLGDDLRSCLADQLDNTQQTFMIILVIACLAMLFAFSGLCLILYNRYQSRKALIRRRQVMFGNGTELTALHTVSDTMMTEFNPNYEFASNLYSIKDLPQIPRESITCIKPLGQGAFGEVFQGIYRYRRNEEAPIAVKTLPTVTTSQAAADFMMEALIMSKFDHPNIVKFIGISFDKNPRYIVLELLAGGDLKNFLREERPRSDRSTNLTMRDLIVCAHDVAGGCKYMEESRFIHRDIAARNCLLTSKGPGRIVKIADFGMARDIYRSDYYKKGGKAMLPIKWMPPESFLDGIFSTKTDVWAFGVLLWEIMSFGYMPYTGCANREVMSMVTTGGRLEKPAGCPDPLYGIMAKCWHGRPEDRPNFSTIVERLGYCLQDPDVINHPMPNFNILPDCDREITIMRPDPEAECINVNAELDGCGYMQPRSNYRPAAYRIGVVPGVVYASLRHNDGLEGETIQETTLINTKKHDVKTENTRNKEFSDNDSPKKQINEEIIKNQTTNNEENDIKHKTDFKNLQNGIIENKNDSINNSTTTNSPLSLKNQSPIISSTDTIKKTTLKAALSLDPSTLYRATIPYEKITFSQQSNTKDIDAKEIKNDNVSHEYPREEECSC